MAYIGVLATAIIVAFTGIRKALKDLKGDDTPGRRNPGGPVDSPAVERTVGGAILDTTTMLMWQESNRAVTEALHEVVDKLESTIHAINYGTEASRAVCRDISELRHQIERLRDKLP